MIYENDLFVNKVNVVIVSLNNLKIYDSYIKLKKNVKDLIVVYYSEVVNFVEIEISITTLIIVENKTD